MSNQARDPSQQACMVLTKSELIRRIQHEASLLCHLASKVDPAKLDYRPTPQQRSTLELLQYLTVMGPIHARTIKGGVFALDVWREMWNTELQAAKAKSLEQLKDALAQQPAFFAEILGSFSDAALRAEMEMFGRKATRGSWLVTMLVSHYAAYRMQLFLYLKASGREELHTLNLWAGMDGSLAAPVQTSRARR
jgi:hypothetical protein